MIYRYEVDYSPDHQAMAAAEYRTTFVVVMADTEPEANLTAAQMAHRYGIPIATRRVRGDR